MLRRIPLVRLDGSAVIRANDDRFNGQLVIGLAGSRTIVLGGVHR